MIVVCEKFIDVFGNETGRSGWLEVGKKYIVYYISIDLGGAMKYCVRSEEECGDWPNIGLHSAGCFRIVSAHTPSIWRAKVHTSGAITIMPEAWLNSNFLAMFYDHEMKAYDMFIEAHNSIIGEEDILSFETP